jgi:AbrB family looped-hinge helix DNA binding protein
MNEVLYMDKGRVTIPKACRTRRGLEDGDTLLFLETRSGEMVLRPVKEKPKMTLLEHLRKFKGVELSTMKFHCPPRI